jgi:hypothetical protein
MGSILFDRLKPTTGSSANGERERARERESERERERERDGSVLQAYLVSFFYVYVKIFIALQ